MYFSHFIFSRSLLVYNIFLDFLIYEKTAKLVIFSGNVLCYQSNVPVNKCTSRCCSCCCCIFVGSFKTHKWPIMFFVYCIQNVSGGGSESIGMSIKMLMHYCLRFVYELAYKNKVKNFPLDIMEARQHHNFSISNHSIEC